MLVHATTLLMGERAVLIRGPSGAGKSSLAWQWLACPPHLPFMAAPLLTRLVADDQSVLEAHGGALVARPHDNLAGRIEVRGLGIMAVPHEARALVGLVIDRESVPRLPYEDETCVQLLGVSLPRLAIAPDDANPTARLIAAVTGMRQFASVFGLTS